MSDTCKIALPVGRAGRPHPCLSSVAVAVLGHAEEPNPLALYGGSPSMLKRILLAIALAASLGGAVAACNTPAGTASPSTGLPSVAAPSTETSPAASESLSAEPSAS